MSSISSSSFSDVSHDIDDDSPKPTIEDLKVRAKITGHETVKESKKDKLHVNYKISIVVGAESCGFSWAIARRYSEFAALHTRLTERFKKSNTHLPVFPKKSLTRNLSNEYIAQRTQELQHYLNDCLLDIEIAHCSEMCNFLVGNLEEIIKSNLENARLYSARASELSQLQTDVLHLSQKLVSFQERLHDSVMDRERLENDARKLMKQRENDAAEAAALLHEEKRKNEQQTHMIAQLENEKRQQQELIKQMDAQLKKVTQEKKVLKTFIKSQPEMVQRFKPTSDNSNAHSNYSPSSSPPVHSSVPSMPPSPYKATDAHSRKSSLINTNTSSSSSSSSSASSVAAASRVPPPILGTSPPSPSLSATDDLSHLVNNMMISSSIPPTYSPLMTPTQPSSLDTGI